MSCRISFCVFSYLVVMLILNGWWCRWWVLLSCFNWDWICCWMYVVWCFRNGFGRYCGKYCWVVW